MNSWVSLDQGQLPEDWKTANAVFKKGIPLLYRVNCKVMEHAHCLFQLSCIIFRNTIFYAKNNMASVRSGRSCETQLLTTVNTINDLTKVRECQMDAIFAHF